MPDLERDLRDLAAAIDFPATPDLSTRVRGRLAERERVRWYRWIAIAVAVAALAVAVGLAVPDARTAIFRFFHIGSVRITFVDRLPQVQPVGPLDLGEPISPAEAPVGMLHSELLGAPDAIYRSGDIVTLLYGTPERVRLLVTQIPASGFTPSVGKKLAATGTHVEFVEIPESFGPGVWITGGPHLVTLPGGPARLASNTLIWQRGRLTVRVEGAETIAQATRIAASLS
jgi:hypothetical protein